MVINTYKDGKRKQKWIDTKLPAKNNKTKAEKLLRETLEKFEKEEEKQAHLDKEKGELLFSEAVQCWFDGKKNIDVITAQGYKTLIDNHIAPYFKGKGTKLKEVNHALLQAFFDEKAERGRLDGKGGLSARSLRLLRNIINQTLEKYIKENVLEKNPCEYVELPSCQRHEAQFYTAEQLSKLFDLIKDEPLYPLVKLTAIYGLRRSEALGLCWDCVSFDTDTILIRRTVVKVSETVAKDKTKNESSRRSFPMTPEIKKLLLSLREQQEKDKAFFGKQYTENNYVFKWADGHTFSPDYVSQKFSDLLKANGMPHIRFHELRHSSASNLLNMGFTLKDVQEWLGHSDIKVTANIYGHLDSKRKATLASAMVSSLSEKGAVPA